MTGSTPKPLLDSLREIVGAGHVITKAEELLVYECDAYTLEKQLPTAVVLPGSTAEVQAIVRACAPRKRCAWMWPPELNRTRSLSSISSGNE